MPDCNCINEVNKQLEKEGLALDLAFQIVFQDVKTGKAISASKKNKMIPCMQIQLRNASVTSRRKVKKTILVTYCPCCGKKVR